MNLAALCSSASRHSSELLAALKLFERNRHLRLHYNIEVDTVNDVVGHGIFAREKISARSTISEVSTESCITGAEILGADVETKNRLLRISEAVGEKFFADNPSQKNSTVNLCNVLFQLFSLPTDPNLPLHEFAKFLNKNTPQHVPLRWGNHLRRLNYSVHLNNLIMAQSAYYNRLAVEFEKHGVPALSPTVLTDLIGIVRSRSLNFNPEEPKIASRNAVTIISPIYDMINHSFDPNCEIEGYYNSVDVESLILLKALRPINPGEELTINYGNYSNYDFAMKFGFINENNPYNEMPLKLAIENHVEIAQEGFDLKQKLFKMISDLEIDKFHLYSNRIDDSALSKLRIYFLTEEDLKQNPQIYQYTASSFVGKRVSIGNELRVFEFLLENIKREFEKLQKMKMMALQTNQQLPPEYKAALTDINAVKKLKNDAKHVEHAMLFQLCNDEEELLRNNIRFIEKNITALKSEPAATEQTNSV